MAPKPASLSMAEAASIPLVGLTAWQALVERAQIKPGQKVLIHAGSGGVGTFAIQLAKHLGATVATTASTANAAMLKELGADVVIDYRSEKFEEKLSGYDVVLNSLDATTLEKSLKVLKPGGKLISIGPPDPAFARAQGLNAVLRLVLRLLSSGIRRKAKARGRRLFISVHARRRKTARADHAIHRRRHDLSGGGSHVRVREAERSLRLHRHRSRQRKGRRHAQVTRYLETRIAI